MQRATEIIQRADRYKLVAGIGHARTELNAFDAALVAAKVGNYNLLRVSSIYPPACQPADQLEPLPGSPLTIAYGFVVVAEPGIRISAAVSVGIPHDPTLPGVIMEYSQHGMLTDTTAMVRSMAEDAMRLRGTAIKQILDMGQETLSKEGATAVFAGVALWKAV